MKDIKFSIRLLTVFSSLDEGRAFTKDKAQSLANFWGCTIHIEAKYKVKGTHVDYEKDFWITEHPQIAGNRTDDCIGYDREEEEDNDDE